MKIRNSTYSEVEECVGKWFVQCHDQNLPESGLMLQQKTEDFAKELESNSEFKASNGWMTNFKKRHNIGFRKICGCLPNKTAAFKVEGCHCGKQLRVIVFLAATQRGKEKLPPLMIGRSKKPRCFPKIRSFPMMHRSNLKAWMSSEIFGDWLKGIDKEMTKKKRCIFLFIDNCDAHSKYHNEIFAAKYDFEIAAT
ncbi:Tigger transposable element-derived protein 4 [Araneus ventricosus]|uniref:Tigger transposable element-derived protein 4 n=1 Tax=Araneus ventricosus TaxID=182803 RepID=A0A4Y2GKM0_ARAVE|nr:Tigger transposable element-derived protein 4 [Araneus ventricosus]